MKFIRFVCCIVGLLLILLCFGSCTLPDSFSTVPSVSDSTVSDPSAFDSLPSISFEKINDTYHDNFIVFREPVTDVLYVWLKSGYGGGLTVMLDPVSGSPLTYQRYLEFYKDG